MEVTCTGIQKGDSGLPVFGFQCSCGVFTAIEVSVNNAIEFAYTCDGCNFSHWITIKSFRSLGSEDFSVRQP